MHLVDTTTSVTRRAFPVVIAAALASQSALRPACAVSLSDYTFEKLPSGVRYADIKPGSGGLAATAGSRVSLQWVACLAGRPTAHADRTSGS